MAMYEIYEVEGLAGPHSTGLNAPAAGVEAPPVAAWYDRGLRRLRAEAPKLIKYINKQ